MSSGVPPDAIRHLATLLARKKRFLHLSFAFHGLVPTATYDQIKAKVDLADDWLKYSDNCWIIWTSESPKSLYQRLVTIPGMASHSIFIVGIDISSENRYGQFPKWIWEWLNKSR